MTIQEYAREVDRQDKLQQEYFAKKRQGIHDKDLLARSKNQEAKVRALTKQILSPEFQEPTETRLF